MVDLVWLKLVLKCCDLIVMSERRREAQINSYKYFWSFVKMCSCCVASTTKVYIAACLSLIGCTGVLLPSIYCTVKPDGWIMIRNLLTSWLTSNHWDAAVTQKVWQWLLWIERHHSFVLAGLIAFATVHTLSSLLMLLGAMIKKRILLLPWLTTDFVLIFVNVLIFVSWMFLSLLVNLLVAIIFPAVAGALIGLWIVLWKNVAAKYSNNFSPKESLVSNHKVYKKGKSGYSSVPLTNTNNQSGQQTNV